MSISFPSADFAPTLSGYTGQGAFRFWCQKVLPIVYDDSLSYYELLNKVVVYLNNVIADVATVEENVGSLNQSYTSLQAYVNEHMQELVSVVNQYTEFTDNYFNNLDVQEEINNKLDEMALDGSLSGLIGPIVVATAPGVISEWLANNITPTSPAIDSSLTVRYAGADAKIVGDALRNDIAGAYDANLTYAVGDYCLYNFILYRCTTAITTPEEWTRSHWQQISLSGALMDASNNAVAFRGVLSPPDITPDSVGGAGYWTVSARNTAIYTGITTTSIFFNLPQGPNAFCQVFVTSNGCVFGRYGQTGDFIDFNGLVKGSITDPNTVTTPGFYSCDPATTLQFTGVNKNSTFLNLTSLSGTVYQQCFIIIDGSVYCRYGNSGNFSKFETVIPHRQTKFVPQHALEITTVNNLMSVTVKAGYCAAPEFGLGVMVISEDVTIAQTDSSVFQFIVFNLSDRTFSLKNRTDILGVNDLVLLAMYGNEYFNISVASEKMPVKQTASSYGNINSFFGGMFNKSGAPFKIVLGGDSITHGVGGTGFAQNGDTIIGEYKRNPDGYCWANLFKEYIEDNYNATVLNNGVTGTYSWWWNNYKTQLIPADTDLFILTLGTNQRTKIEGRNGVSHDEQINNFYNQMKAIVEYCLGRNIPILLCSSIPASRANEERTTGGVPDYPSHVFEYNGVLQRLSSEYNLAYFNLYNAVYYYVRENDLDLNNLLVDGLHPNDEMYRIIFYEYLKGFNLAPSYIPVGLPT